MNKVKGLTHFDKQIEKVRDVKKEHEDMAKYWSVLYQVTSVQALLMDDMAEAFDKAGFHKGKVYSMLKEINRNLDKYFKYTNSLLTLDVNAEAVNSDFEKLYKIVMEWANLES